MTQRILNLAAAIVRQSSREQPADRQLRWTLKDRPELDPAELRQVARTVFAYYRWLGWLNANVPLPRQVREAAEHQERFNKNPALFPPKKLEQLAIPEWVRDHLEVTPAWLRSLQTEPRLWLRARPGHADNVCFRLVNCEPFNPKLLPDTLLFTGEQDLFKTPEFQAGEFELQDLNSQLVGLICNPAPGQKWWDACAGEGGKLMHLSDLMKNQGLIWASDRSVSRLEKLKQRAARGRVYNYQVAGWDGGPKLPTRTQFDGVLIDAPCSGVGTWHRNPQARWTTTPQDVQELSAIQIRLLTHAARALKPGGRLVYAVCTMTRAETNDVVAAFQRQMPEFRPLPLANPLTPEKPPNSVHWLWPQKHGSNGMFIASWTRTQPAALPATQPGL